MLESFYTTVAQAAFTLLGLWWILVELRHDTWFREAAYRRTVYDVSCYFLFPAMMSLGALLAVQEPDVWRVSFVIMGILGLAESALVFAGDRRGERHNRALVAAADVVSLGIYGLIVVFALFTGLPDDIGLGLRALEVEGILVGTLLFLGVALAAAMFVTTPAATARDAAIRAGDAP